MERHPIIPLDAPTLEILQEAANGSPDLASLILGMTPIDEDFDEAFRAVLSAISELIPADWKDEGATPSSPLT
jgi:hypothetical protein